MEHIDFTKERKKQFYVRQTICAVAKKNVYSEAGGQIKLAFLN